MAPVRMPPLLFFLRFFLIMHFPVLRVKRDAQASHAMIYLVAMEKFGEYLGLARSYSHGGVRPGISYHVHDMRVDIH